MSNIEDDYKQAKEIMGINKEDATISALALMIKDIDDQIEKLGAKRIMLEFQIRQKLLS